MTDAPSPWATRRRTPVRANPLDLHLSAMTLRYAAFSDRVLAAAAAGFSGIGLGAVDYLDARRSEFSEEQLADYVARHGLRVVELEFLTDWWREADVRGVRLEEDLLFYLADLLHVPQINVGLFADVPPGVQKQQFRRLCARAADHGVRVALEFMPYSSLRTLEDARRLVAEVPGDNAGLMLDAWHWHRSGGTLDELRTLSSDEVFAVQLCDAAAVPNPDLRHEGRHQRLLPGAGAVDLTGFLTVLGQVGVDLPLAVEVLSDELDARNPVEVAMLAAYWSPEKLGRNYVVKPVHGWEGAGVSVVLNGEVRASVAQKHTEGQAAIYQQYQEVPRIGDCLPVLGTWVIGGHAAGLGIRETDSGRLITDTQARFVPHFIDAPRSHPDQVRDWIDADT